MDVTDIINKDSLLKYDYLKLMIRPNKSVTEISNFKDNILYLNVKEKPIDGKANKEIIRFFKKKLQLNIEIKSGSTSKKKLVKILK